MANKRSVYVVGVGMTKASLCANYFPSQSLMHDVNLLECYICTLGAMRLQTCICALFAV